MRALAGGRLPVAVSFSAEVAADEVESADDEPSFDIEEYALGQIREYVERNFHGHALSDLVAAVLEAEGYKVSVSSPGPDGGVDILAGGADRGM